MASERQNDGKYINWVNTSLALLYLKEGISEEIDQKASDLHGNIKQDVDRKCPNVKLPCKSCTFKSIKQNKTNWSMICKYNVCNHWLDQLLKYHKRLPCPRVDWANCDPKLWPSQPWEVAKVFQPYGCAAHSNAKDADIAGLLTFMLNCTIFNQILTNTQILENIKECRNSIMHSATLQVEDADMCAWLDMMIALLEDPKRFDQLPACKLAADKIKELKNKPIQMVLGKDDETKALSQKVASLTDDVTALRQKTNTLSSDIDEINEQDIDEMKKNISSAKRDISQLKDEVKTYGTSLNDLNVPQLKNKLLELQGRLDGLLHQQDENKTKLDPRIGELEHQMTVTNAGLSTVQENMTTVQENVKINTSGLSTVKENMETVQEKVEINTSGLSTLQENVETVQENMETITSELSTVHEGMEKVQENAKINTSGLSTLQKNVETVQENMETITSELSTVHKGMEKVQENVEINTSGLSTLQENVETVQENMETITSEVSTVHEGMEKVQETVEINTSGLSTLQENVETVQENMETISSELSTVHECMEKVQENVEINTSGLSTLQENVETVQENMETITSELSTVHEGMEKVQENVEINTSGLSTLQENVETVQENMETITSGLSTVQEDMETLKGTLSNRPRIQGVDVTSIQDHLITLYNRDHQKVPIYPLIPEWRENVKKLFVRPSMKEVNPRGERVNFTDQVYRETKVDNIRDIFYSGEKLNRNIYIVAEGGTGKSTLCEYLVYLWVKKHSKMDNEGSKAGDDSLMNDFELLFFISLREANKDHTNIEDMIKSQLDLDLDNDVMSKLMLSYKCLIILDGLDEYKSTHTHTSAKLPGRRQNHNCTILTTSRPWKMELLASELGDKIERQIRIIGLETRSQNKLVKNVVTLLNSIKDGEKKDFREFFRDMKDQKLDKNMDTPILLMQMIGLWHDGESFGKSQCEIYSKFIEKQIQFATKVRNFNVASGEAEPIQGAPTKQKRRIGSKATSIKNQLPAFFIDQGDCQKYQGLLLKLSSLACNQLFGSPESALVFDHEQVKIMGLSDEDVQNCLDLGLLTQYNVLGKISKRQKAISFVHKNHQDFFTAIHLYKIGLGSDLKTILDGVCNLDRALEVEKVFTFVSGMNPDVSREIAKVIMIQASRDPRVIEYQESCLRVNAPHEALVQQIQSIILTAIDESRSNGLTMPAILLHDLWMEDGHQEFPPSRILECKKSLKLSNVTSVFIHTSSPGIAREVLLRVAKKTPSHLNKIVLNGCDITAVSMVEQVLLGVRDVKNGTKVQQVLLRYKDTLTVSNVQQVLKRNIDTLQAIGLYNNISEALDFSDLGLKKLKTIMAPNSLALSNVKLNHDQLELLYKNFGQRPYREVLLDNLMCQCHRKERCMPRLDLSVSKELNRLQLCNIPLQDVVFVPDKLLLCEIGYLPDSDSNEDSVAIRVIQSLASARSLEKLCCHKLSKPATMDLLETLSCFVNLRGVALTAMDLSGLEQILDIKVLEQIELRNVTLTTTQLLSRLATLRFIYIQDMDLTSQEQILPHHMKALEKICIYSCTLTAAQLRQLLDSLPFNKVYVELGNNFYGPVTIAKYDREDDIIEQIMASSDTEITRRDEETYDSKEAKCVVEQFWFYHEK